MVSAYFQVPPGLVHSKPTAFGRGRLLTGPLQVAALVRSFIGHEVNAWASVASRSAIDSQINWQFTTDDARIKSRRLCPECLRRDAKEPSPVPTLIYNE